MSGFLGAAMPTMYLEPKDRRLDQHNRRRPLHRIASDRSCLLHMPCGFANDFWPGNRGFVGDYATDIGMMDATWARRMERVGHGAGSRLGFVGTTRDAAGGRLAGVTCSLFRTSDKLWIMDVVSDVNGDFLLQTFYSPDTHFIVFSKTGSPDVVGTTRQTLVGA